ncbi:alpha/beta hydrolase family protein [Burkholderia glumae]|uniref:alpha/beta hydrolase family protein n=1 Tax=Burkholderia glumae TaxID=337 RepID=UPI0021517A4C|nr:prolyl oligopeptidase family serine peptidase [Burkholderia glumae]
MTPAIRLLRALLPLILMPCLTQGRAEPLDADLHESVVTLDVAVKDFYGRKETGRLAVTQFMPDGDGPFPILILNHGRSATDRSTPPRFRYTRQAAFFVERGFAVFEPTRIGYGRFGTQFDPEYSGKCSQKDYQPMIDAARIEERAVLDYARRQPRVDPHRIVMVGQSVGGFVTTGVAADNPDGLVAAVNSRAVRGATLSGIPAHRARASGWKRCTSVSAARRACRCCGSIPRTTSTSARATAGPGMPRSSVPAARPTIGCCRRSATTGTCCLHAAPASGSPSCPPSSSSKGSRSGRSSLRGASAAPRRRGSLPRGVRLRWRECRCGPHDHGEHQLRVRRMRQAGRIGRLVGRPAARGERGAEAAGQPVVCAGPARAPSAGSNPAGKRGGRALAPRSRRPRCRTKGRRRNGVPKAGEAGSTPERAVPAWG